jgi:hypothetical protein
MREMLTAVAVASLLTLSCTPSDQPRPKIKATPTATAGDQITDMDFESGEVEQPVAGADETTPEPTPLVP